MLKKVYKSFVNERIRCRIRRELTRLNRFFLYGDNYYCNVCENSYKKFLSHGYVRRINARCPNCLSLERTRVLWFYLTDIEKVSERNLKILHFAPEQGIERRIKQYKNVEYYGADLNPNMADYKIDITKIPFKDNSFDLVICSHVLSHIGNEKLALQELNRVVSDSGKILLITHTGEGETISYSRPIKKGNDLVYRIHGTNFLADLRTFGLKVNLFTVQERFNDTQRKLYSLGTGEKEDIYVLHQ